MSKPLHITDDLLISYLLNEISDEEARQVTAWRALNPANEQQFERFSLIWESSKNFNADTTIDAGASLAKVKQRVAEAKQRQAVVVPLRNKYSWLKIAAAVLFIGGCAWVWFNRFANPVVKFETEAAVKIDTLSDGSVVTLNKFARLDHPEKFNGSRRLVNLVKGEAFFNVAHNKARPFIITAGAATIKVVGTSFNVKKRNNQVEVIVETGIVQVADGSGSLITILKAGEMALYNPDTKKVIKLPTPDKLYTYYRSRKLVFKNIPLPRLVAVLNEAYGSDIVIGRKELNNMQMAGVLNTGENLQIILDVIQTALNIKAEKKGETIILK